MGLYGTKAEIRGMLADADFMKHALGSDYEEIRRGSFPNSKNSKPASWSGTRASLPVFGRFLPWAGAGRIVKRRLCQQVKTAIEVEGKRRGWGWRTRRKKLNLVRGHLSIYFAAVNKAARFGVYDRMFALWHVLHMPLFFLLVLTAILHVIAVHLY